MTIIAMLSALLVLGCNAGSGEQGMGDAHPWDGQVAVYGALHAMFHQGQTGPMVALDTLLPQPHLYAVGALAGLAGEITVVGGRAYLSYPEGDASRIEVVDRSDAAATLLVAADVPGWRSVTADRAIRFERLDESIAALARQAGTSVDRRFPFLVEGELEDLSWHVIDGRRLRDGGTSHEDHLAAAVSATLDRASATLVGFYSTTDQGVFTHMGSETHIHCVLTDPLAAGHVDHVTIPAGTTVKFPVAPAG